MSNKKTNKKKHSAPIKTKAQMMAEKKEREDASKKKTIIILSSILAVILILVTVLVCVKLAKRPKAQPGFKANGEIEETVYVKMTVAGYGDIILELDGKEAPITVANFVKLVNDGFYNGLTFHRVIDDFMIQGGDPKANGTGGSPNKIKGEFEENGYHNCIEHKRGVISMARSGNSYDSASSQFFICNATNETVSNLDGKYAAFGYVVSGMSIVDQITSATSLYGDANGTISDKSLQAVITEVKVISRKEALG